MGNLPILGYSSDVFAADQSSCLTYFGETGQEQADKSGAWERCKDDGYLMFIKVIGFFTILLEVIVLSITFLTITDGETGGGGSPRYSHSDGKKKVCMVKSVNPTFRRSVILLCCVNVLVRFFNFSLPSTFFVLCSLWLGLFLVGMSRTLYWTRVSTLPILATST